jgi:DNA-binding PadR family transcriptional regulator
LRSKNVRRNKDASLKENEQCLLYTTPNLNENDLKYVTWVKEAEKRAIKHSLDLIILSNARKDPITGYSAILFVRKQFNLWISAGTIYPILANLENKGLLQTVEGQKNREYKLTIKGDAYLVAMAKTFDRIKKMVATT